MVKQKDSGNRNNQKSAFVIENQKKINYILANTTQYTGKGLKFEHIQLLPLKFHPEVA